MTNRRWIFVSLTLLFVLAAVVCVVNLIADPFGVFRSTRGRSLSVYENERTAKFLLNQKYVPENFDALLIGSSISANWRTSMIHNARVYNESIDGGNAAEEQLLVSQALPAGHFRYALLVIAPFLTHSHQFNEGGMGRPTRREALGSINVLREEMNATAVHLGLQQREFFADGSKTLHTPRRGIGGFPMETFVIDPEALADYKQLIHDLRSRGIAIIFVQPPFYEPIYQSIRATMDVYLRTTGLLNADDVMIDFNGPKYKAFRADRSNFDDGIHLSAAAAVQLSKALDSEIHALSSR
jgi:hypothetical protein